MSEQIKVTIEETERIAVRRTKRLVSFCDFCRTETEMLSPDEIALIYKIGGGDLVALINRGAVHFSETPEGFLLICTVPLDRQLNNLTAQSRHEIADLKTVS